MDDPGPVLVALVALFPGSSAVAEQPARSYEALFESAVNAVCWDCRKEWAYTETTIGSDGVFVGRYDPRRPEGERWILSTVNGRDPSTEEAESYLAEKAGERESDEDHDEKNGDVQVGARAEPGTMRLVDETDEHGVLSFVPSDDNDDDQVGRNVLRKMDGKARIIKDGEYLELLEIRNDGPIRPKVGVKISNFLTRLTFGPAVGDGPIVMKSMEFAIKLRAFLVLRVNEEESVRFSDFEHAGIAPID